MRKSIAHRGKDEAGEYLRSNVGLSQARLSIRDLKTGRQPIVRKIHGCEYAIVYNGEIYNSDEIKSELTTKGYTFETTTDTEVILYAYIEYGKDCVKRLNGIFAFAIWDENERRLMLFRDRCGIKPLFYTIQRGTIIFGSELKALFAHPAVMPEIDMTSLREVFAICPARTEGNGIFKDIYEVKYGCYAEFNLSGFKENEYWRLKCKEHTDSYTQTVAKVRELIRSSVEMQMVSDVPVCSFLSGGVDSCIVTAIASDYLKKQGCRLNTFSFDFYGNDKFFKSNSFQPEQDRPYVDIMLNKFDLNHTYLYCDNEELADYLYLSVDAKDLPGMADVDASMLYFCQKVAQHNIVALTGECADEIFGGYPWFHRQELMYADTFPWSITPSMRTALLKDEFAQELNIDEYIHRQYLTSLKKVPHLEGESTEQYRHREIAYLNIKWFMTTLLDRMDRASMYSSLEARVPYADHRIIEYLWNVPIEYKMHNGVVKGLLRDSMQGLLPDEILYRKKSPYPKTYNPAYENILRSRLSEVISSATEPISCIIDKQKADEFLSIDSDYGKPWFGQLMGGVQLMAYLLQVNYWLKKYRLSIG
jgi:asparagine synthase (glutamine-hydrolysing)